MSVQWSNLLSFIIFISSERSKIHSRIISRSKFQKGNYTVRMFNPDSYSSSFTYRNSIESILSWMTMKSYIQAFLIWKLEVEQQIETQNPPNQKVILSKIIQQLNLMILITRLCLNIEWFLILMLPESFFKMYSSYINSKSCAIVKIKYIYSYISTNNYHLVTNFIILYLFVILFCHFFILKNITMQRRKLSNGALVININLRIILFLLYLKTEILNESKMSYFQLDSRNEWQLRVVTCA